jgi:hypothetical protein
MKKAALCLLVAYAVATLTSCSLVLLLSALASLYPFHATLTVSELAGDVSVEQAEPADHLELGWGLLMDVDNDPLTGDPSGFDVEVSLVHYYGVLSNILVGSGGGEFENLLAALAPGNSNDGDPTETFEPRYRSWSAGSWVVNESGNVTCLVNPYDMNLDTLDFAFSLPDTPVSVSPSCRTRFFTFYYPPPAGPIARDEAPDTIGNTPAVDVPGDASGYSGIDIIGGTVAYVAPRGRTGGTE